MFELIQYAPTTETVKRTPLIIFPPWINKFYIMDLKPKNSLIKWIVDQGYTLFVVSWVNPDASFADVALDDYIADGILTAFAVVKDITGEEKLNAVGYCIAGTTLALALALMEKRGDKTVKAATFFTTLTDFADQGELGVFLDEGFVGGIEADVAEKGILESFIMSRTFSFLRSNDLIYGPAIRSYMLGKAPPAFDLLYWNGDGTNLPAKMTMQYLRDICQNNRFSEDGIEICGERLKISDIKLPVIAIACQTDHIAAWKSSFDGVKKFGSRSKTFVVSESGHIAGIINPAIPQQVRALYQRCKNGGCGRLDGRRHTPRWVLVAPVGNLAGQAVRKGRSGADTRDSAYEELVSAPGTYVKNRVTG